MIGELVVTMVAAAIVYWIVMSGIGDRYVAFVVVGLMGLMVGFVSARSRRKRRQHDSTD